MSRTARIVRFLILVGAAPVGITYQTCAYTDHGFSMLPNIGVSTNVLGL
jgi:hypothetical protein